MNNKNITITIFSLMAGCAISPLPNQTSAVEQSWSGQVTDFFTGLLPLERTGCCAGVRPKTPINVFPNESLREDEPSSTGTPYFGTSRESSSDYSFDSPDRLFGGKKDLETVVPIDDLDSKVTDADVEEYRNIGKRLVDAMDNHLENLQKAIQTAEAKIALHKSVEPVVLIEDACPEVTDEDVKSSENIAKRLVDAMDNHLAKLQESIERAEVNAVLYESLTYSWSTDSCSTDSDSN